MILYLISPNPFVKSRQYDPTLKQNPVGKSMKVTDIPKLYTILLANKQTKNELSHLKSKLIIETKRKRNLDLGLEPCP